MEESKYLSRKFIINVGSVLLSMVIPPIYSMLGISETVTLSVLGTIGAVNLTYSVINYKDAKLDKQ